MRVLRFLMGFVLGLVLGTAIAGLFAPVSGDEVRRGLSGWCNDVLEEARSAAEAARRDAYIRLADLKSSQVEEV
jgi:gas vesicle protein